MAQFAIAEFQDKAVAIICTSWFVGEEEDACLWPNVNSSKVSRLVKVQQEPCSTWEKHSIRVLGKATNYERALEKLKAAEETSDLNTDVEEPPQKRRRFPSSKIRMIESDSEEESVRPTFPHIDFDDLPQPPLSLQNMQNSLQSSPPQSPTGPPSPLHFSTPPAATPSTSRTPMPATPSTSRTPMPATPSTSRTPMPATPSTSRTPMPATPSTSRTPMPATPSTSRTPIITTSASRSPMPATPSTSRPPMLDTPSTSVTLPLQSVVVDGERSYVVGERIMKRILTKMEVMEENQRIILQTLKAMRQQNGCSQEATMPEGLKFPIENIQAFEEMEAHLIDPGMRSGLVNVLADLGGRTFDECTRRTMQFVIDNQLSLKMNMFGRNGKKVFGNSNLFEAVYRAVKRNFTESTKKDAEKSVAKWLIGSRDRNGNRARRGEKGQAENVTPL